MSTVYLVASSASDPLPELREKIKRLWRRAGLARAFNAKDLAAVKLHVGEPGTTTFVSPDLVGALVSCLSETGALPFLTDSAVLYKSPRSHGVGHARVALEHGFTLDRTGAPFVPADGLDGSDDVEVEVNGRHFDKVSIASTIMRARSVLVLSHATGHLGTGFGGTLKNLGMGCCSRMAKLRQHHGQEPRIDPDLCKVCEVCAEWCPTGAITIEDTAVIDSGECIGCGECIAACREGAVAFDWGIMGQQLQERIVDHAAAVVRSKLNHICYVTVAQQITKNCDCLGVSETPLLDDIGLLASFDPVAIDHAVLDLVRERCGRTLESMAYPNRNPSLQLEYAEELGLGTAQYELIRL